MILFLKEKIKENPVFFCFFLIAILYLLPTFIQTEFNNELHIKQFYIGLPRILSGDEPHYFVVTTSLINDHDFYIENNYDNAYYHGACDVGFNFINNTNPTIGRHMLLFNPEKKIVTAIHGENPYNEITYKKEIQTLKEKYNVSNFYQINVRPLGLSMFSALFLWPLRGTCFIEAGVIYVGVFVSFVGIIFFYFISLYYIKKYSIDENRNKTEGFNSISSSFSSTFIALLFTLFFALATQYWHYSKTYFVEPYLATFLLGAFYYSFIKKRNFISGLLLALGFSMKYPFGIYLGLFGLVLLYTRKWKQLFYFILGSALPIVFIMYSNFYLTGNPFLLARAEYLSYFDNYIAGIVAALFHPTFGIIPFAPFLIFSLLGFWILYKHDKSHFVYFCIMIIPYFFFWSSLALTSVGGGGGYSARYDVPLLSFFVLLCLIWFMYNKSQFLMRLFYFLILISLIINIQAAFLYPLFWNNPPWILFEKLLSKWDRVVELIKQSL